MTNDQIDAAEAAPTAAPRSRLRRWGTIVVVTLVVLALVVALVRGWSKVSDYDWELRPGWLALGVFGVLAGYVWGGSVYNRSVEWLSPTAHPSPREAMSIWARSLLARYIPGNVMMVVGRAVMAADKGVPKRVTLAATVYEQALTLGLGAVGAVIFLAAYGDPGEGQYIWLLAVVPIILAFLHPVPFRRLSDWVFGRLGRPSIETLFTGRQVGRLLTYYAVGVVIMMVGIWALVRSAAGPDAGGVAEVGLAFLLAYVISFVAFIIPSGIGIRDGVLALALSRHLPGEVALAISVGLRFALTLIELLFVGLAIAVGRER